MLFKIEQINGLNVRGVFPLRQLNFPHSKYVFQGLLNC